MIIDAFLARDEDQLVNFRFAYYQELVDLFIIGESSVSFSGAPKPLHFTARKNRGDLPANVKVQVIDIPQEIIDTQSTVTIQDFVRQNFAYQVWRDFPESTVFFLDVDEFPSLEQVHRARELAETDIIMTVPMKMFYRRANWELLLRRRGWFSPKIFKGEPKSNNLRSHYTEHVLQGEFGAHLSFLGMGTKQLERKFKDYGHQEYNKRNLWSADFLTFCDRFGLDHLGRFHRPGQGLLGFVSTTNLPGVATAAINWNPAWQGEKFRGSRLGRLVRARIVGNYIHGLDRALASTGKPNPKLPFGFTSYIPATMQAVGQLIQADARKIIRRLYLQLSARTKQTTRSRIKPGA